MVEIDLRHFLRRVHQGRWRIMLSAAMGLVLGIVISLVIPPYYEGNALFLPPKSNDLLSLSQAQGSASSLLLDAAGTEKSDVYLGFLASRSVADIVIERTGLMKAYKAKLRVDAENQLARASTFKVSKNSLIEISVKARTPQLAADITNAYLDALFQLNGDMATSGSAFRRNFFEQQLAIQKRALEQAEVALKNVQQSSGIVSPIGEAAAGINATAELQALIGSSEAQLAGLTAGATDQNPQVVQARRQLAQLRAQLARQQKEGNTEGIASNRSLPGLALTYEQNAREVKLRAALYDAIVKEYEQARISSVDPGSELQIVDRAVVPERKAGPPRRLLAIAGFVLGLLIGLAGVAIVGPLGRMRRYLDDTASEPAETLVR